MEYSYRQWGYSVAIEDNWSVGTTSLGGPWQINLASAVILRSARDI
jgi:hypothetical protein